MVEAFCQGKTQQWECTITSFRMKYSILVAYGLSLKNYFLTESVMVPCTLNAPKPLAF